MNILTQPHFLLQKLHYSFPYSVDMFKSPVSAYHISTSEEGDASDDNETYFVLFGNITKVFLARRRRRGGEGGGDAAEK